MSEIVAGVVGAVGAAKQAIDTAKYVSNAVREYDKAELKLKAADLVQQITELALENNGLQVKIMELQKEIDRLKEMAVVRAELVIEGNHYMRKKADGTKDGPFCVRCWDADGKLIRKTSRSSYSQSGHGHTYHACDQCQLLHRQSK